MTIVCRNNLCIYWKKEKCILKEVTVNEYGACECFEVVSVPNELLDELREQQLEGYGLK